MKVLVLADGMGPKDARGTEIISDSLGKLTKKDIEITVITTLDHFRDKKAFEGWVKEQEKIGLKFIVVNLSWLTRYNRYIALWLSKVLTSFKAIEVLQKEKFDILHEYSSSPFLFLRTFLVSLFGKVKTVHTIITYNSKFLSKPFWSWFGNLLDKVIVPSKGFAENYSRFLAKDKILVISQGVELGLFQDVKANRKLFGLPENKKVILFLGPPEKGKGLFLLLEGISGVLEKERNCFFLFVFHRKLYEKEYRYALEQVREVFKENKNSYKIIESLVDIPTLLASVDIVALPQTIHHGTLVYPQTLLEAMAAGKVVVISDTQEIREIVKDNVNGILFKNNNSKELNEALIRALNAKEKIGKQATEDINNQSLDNAVNKLIDVYKGLI